jgi:predicted amidohydrolase
MQGNPKVNIAVVQMDCVVGETTPNLNKIRHFAALAASLGADIAIYPECCTTGYFIGDKLNTLAEPDDGAIRPTCSRANANSADRATSRWSRTRASARSG